MSYSYKKKTHWSFFYYYGLFLYWSINRTNVCACSTLNAFIRIYYVFVIARAYAANRTFWLACSTAYASICNFICHPGHLLKISFTILPLKHAVENPVNILKFLLKCHYSSKNSRSSISSTSSSGSKSLPGIISLTSCIENSFIIFILFSIASIFTLTFS